MAPRTQIPRLPAQAMFFAPEPATVQNLVAGDIPAIDGDVFAMLSDMNSPTAGVAGESDALTAIEQGFTEAEALMFTLNALDPTGTFAFIAGGMDGVDSTLDDMLSTLAGG